MTTPKESPIADVCTLITRGISPAYDEIGIPVLSQKCIRDNRVIFEASRVSNPEMKRIPPEKMVQLNDVLVNSTGVGTLGRVAQVKRLAGEVTVDSHVTIVRPDPNKIDPQFFGYAMVLNQAKIEAMGEGATGQTELSRTRLGQEIFIPRPPLPVQRRIAAILSPYDELIENNQRRVRILEEMAQALYWEWFVNFRFPEHENVRRVSSSLGDIPEGWEVGRLDDVLVLQRGFDLPKAERIEGDVPIYAATGLTGFHNVAKAKAPGVITGRSGTIGEVLYVQEDFWPLNTTLWAKEFPKSEPLYAFYMLSALDLKQFNSGAAVPTLNRNDIHGLPVLIPARMLQRRFQEIGGAMLAQVRTLTKTIEALRRMRDYLLPRLLSRQLNLEAA